MVKKANVRRLEKFQIKFNEIKLVQVAAKFEIFSRGLRNLRLIWMSVTLLITSVEIVKYLCMYVYSDNIYLVILNLFEKDINK